MPQKPANKPIIAVDIDDVLYPLVSSLIAYLDTEHKVKFSEDDFEIYDLRAVWGGGPEEADEVFNKYKEHVGVTIAPLKDAKEALKHLSRNYDLIIMTARDISSHPRTHDWLTSHFPEIFSTVHLLGNKWDSGGNYREKAEVCKELGVYCLIDDNLRNVTETAEAGIKALLFGSYPWNQAVELPTGVTRVKNWQEVLEFFDAKG